MPISDTRNAPEYRLGDNVVIDPVAVPSPDDMVLARIGSTPVFGIFTHGPGGHVVIAAHNKRWKTEALRPRRGDRIIGVMTEHARPRRRGV